MSVGKIIFWKSDFTYSPWHRGDWLIGSLSQLVWWPLASDSVDESGSICTQQRGGPRDFSYPSGKTSHSQLQKGSCCGFWRVLSDNHYLGKILEQRTWKCNRNEDDVEKTHSCSIEDVVNQVKSETSPCMQRAGRDWKKRQAPADW